ncbi:MAG TPA: rRNA maturation RNase YbeY [Candidatus Krumholzibacteriaceae bacterium]|nr:rRNA maturation RNase YbeY [Candidatus Krumholzibacteriaceae bacterium]
MKVTMLSHPLVTGRSEFYQAAPVLEEISSDLIPDGKYLNLILIGERKMARLNRKYKKRKGPAEILTFSYSDDDSFSEGDSGLLGEIVLCWRSLSGGARSRNVSSEIYLIRLVVHGIFHLFGYTHLDNESACKMEKAEKKYLLSTFDSEEVDKLFI